jgi:ferric enterobactin receptor
MMRFVRFLPFLALLLVFNTASFAQQRTVSGTILADDDNTPLVGVTVTNRNNNQRTRTNSAGYYTITAEKGHVLVFTYVGYAKKEVTVSDDKFANVKMVPADKQETVVTVYGIRREKRALGYSAQELKGEDIASTRRENFINSLAGRVPGAAVTASTGVPGASSTIILRGGTSMGLSNQPLFVVDGVPYDNTTINQDKDGLLNNSTSNRNSDYGNRAADINPEDVETMTVLKGPEAIALYGSDAANGAIIITTKKGKAGKGTVTYDNSFKFDKVYRFHEIQTTFSRGRNGLPNPLEDGQGFEAGIFTPFYFGPRYAPETPLFNNINNFYQTGFSQQHNLIFEGGNEGTTFRLSSGVLKQNGVVPTSAFERYSFRLSSSSRITSKLNVTANVSFIASKTDKVTKGVGGYYMSSLYWPSDNNMQDYINPDGSRKMIRAGTSFTTEYDNPYWDINKNPGADKTKRITGALTFNYDAAKWLNVTAILSADNYTTTGFASIHPQSRFGSLIGYYSSYDYLFTQLTGNLRATVKKNFKKITNTLSVGFYVEDNQRTTNSIKGERYAELDVVSVNNTEPTTRDARLSINNSRKVRMYSNYSIGIANILYPSFGYTVEGNSTLSSRVNKDKDPFYSFGSASLAFVISELPLLKEIRNVDYAKLRISYAKTGKTGGIPPYVIDYSFQPQTVTGGGYAYGVTGNNFNLRPEQTKNFEYGFEMKMFKRRLGIDVSFYSLKTEDQILIPRISYGAGFILKYYNGGLVENKGMEVQLTATPIQKKHFNWDITVNFDRNRNRIVRMPKDVPTYYDSDTWVFGNLRSQQFVGSTITNLAGNGFLKNNNGDVLINPTSGLPIRNTAFETVGERQPDFQLGIINSVGYKNFTLSFTLDIRKGGDIFNGTELALYRLGISKRTLDRETPRVIEGVIRDGLENTKTPTRNTIVIIPYYRNDYYSGISAEANFIEKDINWLRMRDITLSFKFPESVIKKQKIFRALSFYTTATDVFLISNYSGADPSVNSNNASLGGWGGIGIDFGSISAPRSMSVGLRATF